MDNGAWNTKRKIWHVSGCLSILPIYFLLKSFTYPICGMNFILALIWILAGLILAIDITRLYYPGANSLFKNLPFFGGILREHEKNGYNASTFCLIAVATIVTWLYFGLISEAVLLSAITTMAVADPLAALARIAFSRFGTARARLLSVAVFAGTAVAMTAAIFHFYSGIDWRAIVLASIVTAVIEAYMPSIWNLFIRFASKLKLDPPLFISAFYPDDNFTSPLFFASILMLFGL